MSLFTLRGRVALAGSIVTALVGACAVPVVAQDKTSPPNFAPDPMVGWIGVGGIRPVPGTVSPLAQDPKYPFVPNGTGQQPTYRIADLSNPRYSCRAGDGRMMARSELDSRNVAQAARCAVRSGGEAIT